MTPLINPIPLDMGNAPVLGCERCNTTGGRMACYLHGLKSATTITMNDALNDYFKRCKNGHPPSHEYKYCPECGEKL